MAQKNINKVKMELEVMMAIHKRNMQTMPELEIAHYWQAIGSLAALARLNLIDYEEYDVYSSRINAQTTECKRAKAGTKEGANNDTN